MRPLLFRILCSALLLFAACKQSPNAPLASLDQKDSLPTRTDTIEAAAADTAVQSSEASYGFFYCASPVSNENDLAAQQLIGKRIPNLEDSTLLTFVYGSCYQQNDKFVFNAGVQMWDESDSIYMSVQERLGNDSIQIIYLRGEMAITTTMHNHYSETALLLQQTREGWKTLDAYVDAQTIDFNSVKIAGEYWGHFLLQYETAGTYANGVSYTSLQYMLLGRRRLNGPDIVFTIETSNGASGQCEPIDENPDYHCDCYAGNGEVDFAMDPQWNCLVFQYQYERTEGDCAMRDAKTFHARQTWYMNADTAFLGNGALLSEWAEDIEGKVKLSKSEIKANLGSH